MHALTYNKALAIDARHKEPDVADGDTLVRVRQAGICGTDLEIAKGLLDFTGILGRDFVGDVVSSPTPELVGQRVVARPEIACGKCDLCMAGLANHCRRRKVLGMVGRDGAFAEFVRVPADNLHALPQGIDDDQAVFILPLAAAFGVLRHVKVDSRTFVTVLGDGRIGLLVAQVFRNAGAPVRVLGRHPDKLALCEKWQVKARPIAEIVPRQDQDVVIDCTGSPVGLDIAAQLARPRGTIVLKSIVKPAPVNLAAIVVNELSVIGCRDGPIRQAIDALADKSVEVASLIHRRMRLDQGVEAFALAERPGVLKVILTMNQNR